MGSSSEKGLSNHRRLPRIGMVNGPGGSFLLELELRRNLRMAETQREIRMMSHTINAGTIEKARKKYASALW